jgi:hypothetical protein
LFLFLVLLLLIVFIVEARRHSQVMQCQSKLRGLAISCLNYYNDFNSYPIGTVVSKTLQPEDRLSWMTRIIPTYVEGGYSLKIDWEKGWDTPENNPPMLKIKFVSELETCGKITWFLCPSYASDLIDKPLSVTGFVGISGVGEDAASLPLSHARAGMFGNDRRVTMQDIKDGQAHTLFLMETLDTKPWTAGGYATMRAFIPGKPTFGLTAPFGSAHSAGFFTSEKSINAVFADGSTRSIAESISPKVLEAYATINGGDGDE